MAARAEFYDPTLYSSLSGCIQELKLELARLNRVIEIVEYFAEGKAQGPDHETSHER